MTLDATFSADWDVFRAQSSVSTEEVVPKSRSSGVGDIIFIREQLQFQLCDAAGVTHIFCAKLNAQKVGS